MATTPQLETATLIRDRGDRGRVLRYTGDDGLPVYAKFYATPFEAERCVDVLTSLRREGFHDEATHRVPAVLDHRPEDNMVVLAAAPGVSLASLLHDRSPPSDPGGEPWLEGMKGPARWLDGVKGAARWLADLHETPTSVCRSTDRARAPLDRFRTRRDVLVASRPELADETADLLQTLLDRSPPAAHAVHRTTHGRYHPEHVFLGPGADVVTGIDLDRATPGDPARDLGEFVHRARSMWSRAHGRARRTSETSQAVLATTPDQTTAVFLDAYRRHRSGETELTSLVYHWSFATLWHLLGSMGKDRSRTSLDRHRAEFADVPRLVDELT